MICIITQAGQQTEHSKRNFTTEIQTSSFHINNTLFSMEQGSWICKPSISQLLSPGYPFSIGCVFSQLQQQGKAGLASKVSGSAECVLWEWCFPSPLQSVWYILPWSCQTHPVCVLVSLNKLSGLALNCCSEWYLHVWSLWTYLKVSSKAWLALCVKQVWCRLLAFKQ